MAERGGLQRPDDQGIMSLLWGGVAVEGRCPPIWAFILFYSLREARTWSSYPGH